MSGVTKRTKNLCKPFVLGLVPGGAQPSLGALSSSVRAVFGVLVVVVVVVVVMVVVVVVIVVVVVVVVVVMVVGGFRRVIPD